MVVSRGSVPSWCSHSLSPSLGSSLLCWFILSEAPSTWWQRWPQASPGSHARYLRKREPLSQELGMTLTSLPWVMSLSLNQLWWPRGWNILGTTCPFRAGVGSDHTNYMIPKGERNSFLKGNWHERRESQRCTTGSLSWLCALTHYFPWLFLFHVFPILQALPSWPLCWEALSSRSLHGWFFLHLDLCSNVSLLLRPPYLKCLSHSPTLILLLCWI